MAKKTSDGSAAQANAIRLSRRLVEAGLGDIHVTMGISIAASDVVKLRAIQFAKGGIGAGAAVSLLIREAKV